MQNSIENLEMNNVEAESTVKVGLTTKILSRFFQMFNQYQGMVQSMQKERLSFEQKQHQI